MAKKKTSKAKYALNSNGSFVIKDYNSAKTFSNFFPGIAGLWGIPMWVFYVNRGQCITSFGIESKDKAIMEFQPANKAYRQTALQGFRTFVKVKQGKKVTYWEPFQNNLKGTDFKKSQTMSMTAHDLTLEEKNDDLGLVATVNYFTLPDEPYAALVRQVSIKNVGKKKVDIELIDGMPIIVPYGLSDGLMKNMSRTAEAWIKVRNLENKAPYYQLNVEISDTPVVTHIKEGNFFFSFDPSDQKAGLLSPISEYSQIFGESHGFIAPENFLEDGFKVNKKQMTDNKTPCAMSHHSFELKPKESRGLTSMFGYAQSVDQLNKMVKEVTQPKIVEQKSQLNKDIIDHVKSYALTKSSSEEFNLYSSHTFLDNILRGGLPVSVKTKEGFVAFNVYSRKHGDPERDYNYFTVAPTFYSQGNGNYRDVNQNRRNDVWFNTDVKASHLVNFLNLSQVDGYNPLVVKGASFTANDEKSINQVLNSCVDGKDQGKLRNFLKAGFLPGELLGLIQKENINLKVSVKDFFGQVLEVCQKQELADHGEGFWSDHWTYNLDLIESYLGIYPEELNNLLLEERPFTFFHNDHYVVPRDQRYVLTERGVRQYHSVAQDKSSFYATENGTNNKIKEKNGEGAVYHTHLACKILCLIANKVASLDPSGVGVEMEGDKPNWYDALNGLPGLTGSSISETFEIQRIAKFLLESLKKISIDEHSKIPIYEELATFISGLNNLLGVDEDALSYWNKSNDIKENYRQRVRHGIDGTEVSMSVADIKIFLTRVIEKTTKAFKNASNKEGFLTTYFYHEVTDYKKLDTQEKESGHNVRPLKFKRHDLPLYLEGYVHSLKVQDKESDSRKLYNQVRKSALFDQKLNMYKVNTDLSNETEEIGRTRIFPHSWLENESIWLHMEYKFILELIRGGLHEEYYDNFKKALIPFLKPSQYGRSILENSSFIVSSAHEDPNLHGQGFVARLSGSTAEFLHMWLIMNVGLNPFSLNAKKELCLQFKPILPGWLFTKKPSKVNCINYNYERSVVSLPKNIYAFNFLANTLIVYHNPKKKDTFGKGKVTVKKVDLTYPDRKKAVTITSSTIGSPHAQDIREGQVQRIDIHLG